jgi:3-oxoacyl-[acyl-carrier-protein] synthase II
MPTPRSPIPVVVTGMGAVTPLGANLPQTWEALLAGKSGARYLTEEWAEPLPVRIGAPSVVEPASLLDRVEARKLDRSGQFALAAAREAWSDAGRPGVEPERLGVSVSSGIGGISTLIDAWETLRTKGSRLVSPLCIPMLMPNGPAGALALEFGARAGAHAPVSACSSGAEAIALGLEMIRSGRADVVIAGGTEAALHPLPLAAFAAMRALSQRQDAPQEASRPFDKGRDGFVLGEGGAVLVLERADHAAARGATVYGELLGAGLSSDAYHIAAPDPDGAGAARAVTAALVDAGLAPEDIGHINVHATSTPAGDVAEIRALHSSLGDAAGAAKVSATKGCTGHLLGAAGALEAQFAILAGRLGIAPATRNLDNLDEECDLDVVRIAPARIPTGTVALSTSFGFGGHNVALVVRGAA